MDKKKNSTTPTIPAQLRHLAKAREGFEHQLEALIALYREKPQELYLAGITPELLETELAEYRAALETEQAAKTAFAAALEARIVRGSQLWGSTLGLYGRARLAGRTDTTVKTRIAGMQQFMRTKKKRAAPTTTTTAPVSPPAPVSMPATT